jgi:hypothetical protein
VWEATKAHISQFLYEIHAMKLFQYFFLSDGVHRHPFVCSVHPHQASAGGRELDDVLPHSTTSVILQKLRPPESHDAKPLARIAFLPRFLA